MRIRIAGVCIALLLLFTGAAFAQWQSQYSIQQNFNFNAVHFPTSLVGYTVGGGGVIFKTIDGGLTWTQQTSPTVNSLNDVFFTDATHGYAVGAAGTIVYTADGANWAVHSQSGVITTATIYGISFVGSDGWIGGGADNVACQIYKTTDGGTTWGTVVTTNPSTDMCTDISFADANRGYASIDANGCMYTADGGATWTRSTMNYGAYPYTRFDVEGIMAISTTAAVATGWGSQVGGQPTVILVSTDGGASFSSPDPNYSWATYTYGQNFAKFGDGQVIAVGGGSQSAGIAISATGPSYTTWTRLPAFYGDEVLDACALPGTNTVVGVGSSGLIARSTDRGATWSFIYDAGMPFQGIQDFADAGANRIFASGAGGSLLYFDVAAGTHRYMMASPKNWGPTVAADVDYVANVKTRPPGVWDDTLYNDVMYYCGNCKYLCKSYDFGQTWTELSHTNVLADGFLSMYWLDTDTGWIVGHKANGNYRDEVIWKTTDGGWTLTEIVPPSLPGTNMQYNGIDFAPGNTNVGVVVADDNYIRYTTDGGVNWPLATENWATGTDDVEDVTMLSSTVGFAVGDNGMLLKTTDGGANWLTQTKPWGTTALLDIESSGNHIWIAGADQFLYYSADAGATWTSAAVTPIVTTYDVMAVYYQGPAGLLWVGCHYANVLNRSDAVAGVETPKSLPFVLNQNYPNPFNPSTTIDFTLTADDHVSLNVYDVSGKLVAKVLDKDMRAGSYNVGFRADGLSTGVYFYKLQTSKGEETRKMVLIR